jgi:VWFA-related protein
VNAPARRRKFAPSWLLAAAALCLDGFGAAQSQTPVIRADVREVLVPVVVTDRKGRHVDGLKEEDFAVLEDGSPQRIVAFRKASDLTESELAPAAVLKTAPVKNHAPTVAPEQPLPRSTYLVLVDLLHSEFADFSQVRRALTKFLARQAPGDSQYILATMGRGVHVVKDSTRDPAALLAAVRSDSFARMLGEGESSTVRYDAAQFNRLAQDYCAACDCSAYPAVRDQRPACSARKAALQQFLNASSERTFALTENFLAALDRVVTALGAMPGSRTVLFLSDGWNGRPGRDLYMILQAYGPKDQSFQLNPRDTGNRFLAVLHDAVRNNVRFYSLDSRGVFTQASLASAGDFDASQGLNQARAGRTSVTPGGEDSMLRAVAEENGQILAQLARATGGLFFHNSNDLERGLRRAFDDGHAYYMLAYTPSNPAQDGSYRKITVEVKNPKLTVMAKAGYWASPN